MGSLVEEDVGSLAADVAGLLVAVPVDVLVEVSAAVATAVAVLSTRAAVAVAVAVAFAVAVGSAAAGAAAALVELGGSDAAGASLVAGAGLVVVVSGGGVVVAVLGGSVVPVVPVVPVVGVVLGGVVVGGVVDVVALPVGDGLVLVGDGFVVGAGALVVGRLVVGVPVGLLVDGGRPPVLLGDDVATVASVSGTSPSATVRMTRLPGSSTRCGTTAYGTDAVADGAKPRYGAGST